jgi:deoxyribonuclease V
MILAIDVYYYDDRAKTVGVLFNEWKDETCAQIVTAYTDKVATYESGNFYKRELPCIINLLDKVEMEQINTIVIDGYVYLDNNRKHGLGYYLYEYLVTFKK